MPVPDTTPRLGAAQATEIWYKFDNVNEGRLEMFRVLRSSVTIRIGSTPLRTDLGFLPAAETSSRRKNVPI